VTGVLQFSEEVQEEKEEALLRQKQSCVTDVYVMRVSASETKRANELCEFVVTMFHLRNGSRNTLNGPFQRLWHCATL